MAAPLSTSRSVWVLHTSLQMRILVRKPLAPEHHRELPS